LHRELEIPASGRVSSSTFTTPDPQRNEHPTIPLPPVLGGAGLVCGVVLLIASVRP